MSKTFTKLNRFTAFPQARSDKSSGSCSSSSNSSTTSSPVGGERQNVETFEEFAPMVRRWNMDEDGRESKNIIESKDLPIGYIPPAEKIALRELSKKDEAKERLATNEKVYQSAMTTAQAPGGQLFMTAFMMWMSGSTLQIFSIFFLSMAFMTPLRAIMNANQGEEVFSMCAWMHPHAWINICKSMCDV